MARVITENEESYSRPREISGGYPMTVGILKFGILNAHSNLSPSRKFIWRESHFPDIHDKYGQGKSEGLRAALGGRGVRYFFAVPFIALLFLVPASHLSKD